ncbi:MAG TPA: YceI family protein [Actinomycetota bacterium]|nr:YceI family protein [Actinomycetota bacterium]
MAWNIDTAHTSVGFVARHLGLSKVRGQFASFRGEVEGDPSDVTTAKGWFEVDLASIDTGNADRDAHLKSADFFDVEKFPTMRFVSKRIEGSGDTYRVTGDLTIKDVTKEVTLDYEHGGEVIDPYGNRKIGGTLTGTVKRSEWGLTWNVPLESGGWLVSDNIKLEIDVQVAESKEAVEEEAKAEAEISG